MAKALRTAAIVVGAVALIATGVGAIGAIAAGTSISTGIAGASIAGISAGTLAAGASVLALASSAIAPKPSYAATGNQSAFTLSPDGPVPIAFGRTGTAGSAIFRRTFDTSDKGDNDRRAWVIVHSLGPIDGYESFKADDVDVSFGAGGQANGSFAGFMWQTRQLGLCPEPSPLSFGTGAGTPPGWDGSRKLSGLAAATWTLRFDTKSDHYQNGQPAPMWVLRGVKVYDPRKDSTYPGGIGAQRADDQSTWAYSDNPYLCGLAWCLGFYQNGQRVMGLGAPIGQIDVASFVDGANIADLNGWKISGVAYSTDSKWQVLNSILQAGMGQPLQLGAMISCFCNSPKVSLGTITVDDVVGDASVTATQPRRDRINGIVPRYRQEKNGWQLLSGTPARVPAHEAEDGGRRSKEVEYPFIPADGLGPDGSDKQVAVAARYDIENAREFGPITLPLKLRWIGFKPGDVVTAHLPELGLVNQPILLLNRDFDPSSGVPTFTARSETNAKHAFALGQTTEPPPTPGVSGPPLIPVPGPTAWAITATAIISEGNRLPAIVVEGVIDSPIADAVVFEYRPYLVGQADDQGWVGATTLPPTTREARMNVIAAGTEYEAAVSYQRRGQTGGRRILGPALADQLVIDWSSVGGDGKPEDGATVGAPAGTFINGIPVEVLTDDVRTLMENGGEAPSHLAPVLDDRIENIIWNTIRGVTVQDRNARREHEAVTEKFDEERVERQTLEVKVDDNYAIFQRENAVRISETTALATNVTDISVQIGQAQADLIVEQEVRASADAAQVSSIEQIDTRLGTAEAQIVTDRQASVSRDSANVSLINGVSARLNSLGGTGQTVEARVASAFNAISNEAGARADAITQVTTNFNGQIGGVQETLTSVSNRLGNVESRWTVQVQAAGGHTAAVGLYSATGQPSEFAVMADRFIVLDGSGNGTSPFFISGGQTFINNAVIPNAAVGTLKIGANAVSVSGGVSRDNSASTPGTGSEQTILSTSVTFAYPARVAAIAFVQQAYSANPPLSWSLFLKVNGSQVQNGGGTLGNDCPSICTFIDVPAGTTTLAISSSAAPGITARGAALVYVANYR